MNKTAHAEKVLMHLLATLPHSTGSQREQRARAALWAAAQALRDYGTETAAKEAITSHYSNR
jgi:type II secretory pathway pseudopilin PulG